MNSWLILKISHTGRYFFVIAGRFWYNIIIGNKAVAQQSGKK